MKDIQDLVSSLFNITDDMTPFYEAMEQDEILGDLIRQLWGLEGPDNSYCF